jgi:hypothetical protein
MRTLYRPISLKIVMCIYPLPLSAGALYYANVNLTSLPSSDKAEGCSKLPQVYFHTRCLASHTDSLLNSSASGWNLPLHFSFLHILCLVIPEHGKTKKKKNFHGLSPRANYTDRATAACRRSDCQLLRIEGATWSACWIPTAVFSGFLDRSRYFSIK